MQNTVITNPPAGATHGYWMINAEDSKLGDKIYLSTRGLGSQQTICVTGYALAWWRRCEHPRVVGGMSMVMKLIQKMMKPLGNRMKIKRLLLIAILSTTVLCGQAYAASWHTSTIQKVYPLGSGDVVLLFSSDSAACANVNSPKYYYIRVGENGMTAEGRDVVVSVALTAATTGKQVSINFDETNYDCVISRLSVDFSS